MHPFMNATTKNDLTVESRTGTDAIRTPIHTQAGRTGVLAGITGRLFALTTITVVFGLFIMGCGGSHTTFAPTKGGGTPGTAIFIGSSIGGDTQGKANVCAKCHASTVADIMTQAHGLDFTKINMGANNLGKSPACLPCHVTGYQDPNGWKDPATTPQLENIGCEDCHGAGSLHAGSPSGGNITGMPDAKKTCWSCHVSEYKQIDENPGPMTADQLKKAGLSSGPHHPQTLELLGMLGYERPNQPSPHSLINNTCVACHINPVKDPTDGHVKHDAAFIHGNPTTCAGCHGDAGTLMTNYQTEIKQKLIALGGESAPGSGIPDSNAKGGLLAQYATAHSITATSDPNDPAVIAYKGARYNYNYIIADKSFGVHNPPYTEELITDANGLLSQAP